MKIVQITDIHIHPSKKTKETYGMDIRSQFVQTLQRVLQSEKPDKIVYTGDFCFKEPLRDTYDWLKPYIFLEKPELIPYKPEIHIITGNHDNNELLAKSWGIQINKNNELYYSFTTKHFQLLFLDSHASEIGEKQTIWLKNQLKTPYPIIIFNHYPIWPVDMPYMENNWALKKKKHPP